MKEVGVILICAVPSVVGIIAVVYALIEAAVLEPLGKAILIVPVYDPQTPVSEMLRVVRLNSFGHSTVVADMTGRLIAPEKLVELGLCDAVTDAAGAEHLVRSQLRGPE